MISNATHDQNSSEEPKLYDSEEPKMSEYSHLEMQEKVMSSGIHEGSNSLLVAVDECCPQVLNTPFFILVRKKNYTSYLLCFFPSYIDFNLERIIMILTDVKPTELAAMFLSILSDSSSEYSKAT